MEKNHLNELQKKGQVSLFTLNGIKLVGDIAKHDSLTILLIKDKKPSLIYKSGTASISTLSDDLDFSYADDIEDQQEEVFDDSIEKMFIKGLISANVPVRVYLTSGTNLSGVIKNYNKKVICISPQGDHTMHGKGGKPQLIYKSALSSIVPNL
jgi:RNA chaperone Hfq